MPTYNPPTLPPYNQNPPSNDGNESDGNLVDWDTILTKLTDVLKTFSEAINTEVENSFNIIPESSFVTDGGGPYVSSVVFDLFANVVNTQVESIGPTGSAADNIWTALDSVPAGSHWVELRIVIRGTGGNVSAEIYGSSNSVIPTSDTQFEVASAIENAAGLSRNTSSFKLPVDSGIIFNILMSNSLAPGTFEIDMYLTGYGRN